MSIGETYKVLIEEGAAFGIIWGIPAWLVFRAWRRYRQLNSVPAPLRVAMLSLLFSEGMLVLIGAAIVLEDISSARIPFTPQKIGVINFLLCVPTLLISLAAKTQDTLPAGRAIAVATIYLIFLWLYAMVAH